MRARSTPSSKHRPTEARPLLVARSFAPGDLDLDALAEALRMLMASDPASGSPPPPSPESTCVPAAEEGVMSWDQEPVLVGT